MRITYFSIIFLFILSSGFNTIYDNNKVLTEIYGNLDKDSIKERVTVTELDEEGEDGKIRILEIFKKSNNNWKLIAASKTAILGSEAGGMMGDPFFDKSIEIKNNAITIAHYGGSSWKWSTIHKYRLQNTKFELIGYSTRYGKICEYWAEFDFNLSSGKINYKKEYETCDEETGEPTVSKKENETFYKKLKKLPTIETINTKEITISTPKYKEVLDF